MSSQPLGLQQIVGDEVSALQVATVAAKDPRREVLGDRLAAIGAELAAATATKQTEADPPAAPALTLHRASKTINYMCLPEGPELGPFRAALAAMTHEQPPAPQWAEKIDEAAEIWVFVAAACPHCPEAVRAALQVTLACPAPISLSVIDTQLYPELAEQHGARSVPLTLIDRELGLTGTIDVETLAGHLAARHTEAHDAALFVSAVESGPEAATAQLLDGQVRRFVAAWRGSTTSLRMGMLLAAEEALEQDAKVLDEIVGELTLIASSDDEALRGDTVDLLSKIGHPDSAETFGALLDDPDEDIAEIAAEGLEAVKARSTKK